MQQEVESQYPTMSLEALLRCEDVARILNISRSLAYQLLQRGEIPTVRLGRTVRIRPKDLEEFIANRISAGM